MKRLIRKVITLVRIEQWVVEEAGAELAPPQPATPTEFVSGQSCDPADVMVAEGADGDFLYAEPASKQKVTRIVSERVIDVQRIE